MSSTVTCYMLHQIYVVCFGTLLLAQIPSKFLVGAVPTVSLVLSVPVEIFHYLSKSCFSVDVLCGFCEKCFYNLINLFSSFIKYYIIYFPYETLRYLSYFYQD